ncbi:hypothetical protein EYF80_042490 [Liparis tanakae]|uniref:Uncharacterized protein n=1 Tax=Liparis tanakae TaxID=230148 RepID=A0A4Z2G2E4_9TELE|nr:hypothetical protein EYF80_042490 [Liparis tanakae]
MSESDGSGVNRGTQAGQKPTARVSQPNREERIPEITEITEITEIPEIPERRDCQRKDVSGSEIVHVLLMIPSPGSVT